MQSFNYICYYLYICAIVRSIHNEVLNASLLDDHFSHYLNNLNVENLSIVKNCSAMNRKVRSDVDTGNRLNLFTTKESYAEVSLRKNSSALLQEESLASKLVVTPNNDNLFSPMADMNRMKLNMEYLFSYARNSVSNMTAKIDIQHHIINSFKMTNMQTFTHEFISGGLSSPVSLIATVLSKHQFD